MKDAGLAQSTGFWGLWSAFARLRSQPAPAPAPAAASEVVLTKTIVDG